MSSKKIKTLYLVYIIIINIMIIAGLCMCGFIAPDRLVDITYYRDIAIDTMGLFVGGVLLIGLVTDDRLDKLNRSMFRIIVILCMLFFTDMVSAGVEGHAALVWAVKFINTIAFISENFLGYTYWTYIREELRMDNKRAVVIGRICKALLGIAIILDLLNLRFGYLFTVSDAGEYIDQTFEFVGDIPIVLIFVIIFWVIICNRETSTRTKMVLLSFESFPFAAYVVGSITQEYIWVEVAYLLSILLIYIRIFSLRGKKLAEQEVVLTKQSTALMISQIQPHFLYNVLTTISNLCVTDPEEAEETTVLFSQYLRTNLDSLRNQEPVPFATELGHIKTYVELEKKRFGDKLNVEYDIKEVGFEVPSLGLQPIVENSIKHGIRGKNEPGHIKIGSYKDDQGYLIVIEDDGVGFDMNMPAKDDGRSHVGMINVRERLKRMCNATMEINSSPGCGCCTKIHIPG